VNLYSAYSSVNRLAAIAYMTFNLSGSGMLRMMEHQLSSARWFQSITVLTKNEFLY